MNPTELTQLQLSTNLKKDEVAEKLGVSPITFGRWERGVTPIPFPGMLRFAFLGLQDEIQSNRNDDRDRVLSDAQNSEPDTIPTGSVVGDNPNHHFTMGNRPNPDPLPKNGAICVQGNLTPTKERNAMIIAIFNQAGGVGKSTLTRDLGFELSQMGQKVLLVDGDSQGTLSSFLGLDPGKVSPPETFWHIVANPEKSSSDQPAITQTKFGMDIGIANRLLGDQEHLLAQQHNQARLLSFLKKLKENYDIILIDCSPKISEVVRQILMASDGLLIPVQTEVKSVSSFYEVHYEIKKAQQRRADIDKPPLVVLGVVPTLHNPRRSVHLHHLNELNTACAAFEYQVYNPVRDYIAVTEAGTQEMPLKLYDSACPVNQEITTIAQMILKQISQLNKTETLVTHG